MKVGGGGEAIQRLIEVFAVTPAANGNQGQKLRLARGVQAIDGTGKTPHLRQCVVQDVAQSVTVTDQALDEVKPELAMIPWL